MAAITRWTGGRFPRAFDFINAQRRRHVLISEMEKLLKDYDMYIPTANGDIGLHAQTGHPCAVVQYKFEPQPAGRGGGPGRGGAGAPGGTDTAGRGAPPPEPFNAQPICATLAGNLYNDDLILSVAHQFQNASDWHKRRPKI
jgi:Asp-tRNA(Asn)/Glu-tRNA(Gln) amidotransferase A subunit family amidase